MQQYKCNLDIISFCETRATGLKSPNELSDAETTGRARPPLTLLHDSVLSI